MLAEHGKVGFYEGKVADSLVKCVQDHGGVMTSEDLQNHQSTFDCPIKTCYRGIDVWEMPPNGQGITALLALNILEGFDFTGEGSPAIQAIIIVIFQARIGKIPVDENSDAAQVLLTKMIASTCSSVRHWQS